MIFMGYVSFREGSINQDASRAHPVALAQDQHIESSEVVGFGAEMEHCSNCFGILVATVVQLGITTWLG